MNRTTMLGAVAALALALAGSLGCRTTHLGDDTGRAYRQALVRQSNSEAEGVANMTAEDAKAALRTHRDPRGEQREPTSNVGMTSLAPALTSSSSSSSGSSGAWQGASGNIRIEAK